jgi:acyl carrier protein
MPEDSLMTERDHIRSFILENYLLTGELETLGDEVSLSGAGIIDSSGMLEMVLFLEEKWGIKVADEEMLPENFDSVAGIAAYLERKRSADSD